MNDLVAARQIKKHLEGEQGCGEDVGTSGLQAGTVEVGDAVKKA